MVVGLTVVVGTTVVVGAAEVVVVEVCGTADTVTVTTRSESVSVRSGGGAERPAAMSAGRIARAGAIQIFLRFSSFTFRYGCPQGCTLRRAR